MKVFKSRSGMFKKRVSSSKSIIGDSYILSYIIILKCCVMYLSTQYQLWQGLSCNKNTSKLIFTFYQPKINVHKNWCTLVYILKCLSLNLVICNRNSGLTGNICPCVVDTAFLESNVSNPWNGHLFSRIFSSNYISFNNIVLTH